MKIFDQYIDTLQEGIDDLRKQVDCHDYRYDPTLSWPQSQAGELILGAETAIELGHPATESVSFLMWTDSLEKVADGRITLFGPELKELPEGKNSFGKVVLISGQGFTEENGFDRWQELEAARLTQHLKGQMLRAVPQQSKEWSRISRQGIRDGLSLRLIGNELIRRLKSFDYVDQVETIFITSSRSDVASIKDLSQKAGALTTAMNRIFDDLEMDCGSCDFSEVCDEVEELKNLHRGTR